MMGFLLQVGLHGVGLLSGIKQLEGSIAISFIPLVGRTELTALTRMFSTRPVWRVSLPSSFLPVQTKQHNNCYSLVWSALGLRGTSPIVLTIVQGCS